jgi:hypothetical protein
MGKLASSDNLSDGRRCDREVVVLWMRSQLWFESSLRNLVEMMAKRSLGLAAN